MDDIEIYLNALKKLYSLLILTDARQSHQTHTSQDNIILDEEARFLLKLLLDSAAKKLLKASSEVIASILGLSNTHSFNEQQKSQDSKAPLSTNAENTLVDVVKQTDRVPDNETVQSVASEQSEASIYPAELHNRKKRCRICQRSNSKQLKSIERGKTSAEGTDDINKDLASVQFQLSNQGYAQEKVLESNIKTISDDLSNEREMHERILGLQFNLSGSGARAYSVNTDACGFITSGALQNFATGTEKRHKDIDCISKDASDAIQAIESRISALKVGVKRVGLCSTQTEAQQVGPFQFGAGSVFSTGTSSLNMEYKEGLVSQGDQTQVGRFALGKNDSHSVVVRRRARERKGQTQLRQVPRYVENLLNELNLPNKSFRNSASISPRNTEQSKLLCQNVGKDSEIRSEGNTFCLGEKLIEGQKLGIYKDSLHHYLTENYNILSQTNIVQGLEIPTNLDQKEKKNSLQDQFSRKTNKSIVDGDRVAQNDNFRKVGKCKTSVPEAALTDTLTPDRKLRPGIAGNKQIRTRPKMIATSKGLPHRTTIRKTLPANKPDRSLVSSVSYEDRMEEETGKVKKKINYKHQQIMSSDHQESNGSTSNGTSSSSWTTQHDNSSYHDSEEYSVTEQSHESQKHSATNASSESDGHYVSGSTQGPHSDYVSYSQSEFSSAPTSPQSLEDSISSSGNTGYLPSDQTSSLPSSDLSYRHRRYSRRYRSTDRRRPIEKTGRLKKLKEKLAIIFHHHHHHHHHHYNDDSNHSAELSHAYRGPPLSKHAVKMFNKRKPAEVYGEKAAEKLSKSMVRRVPNKKRGANLNKLVNGLVRHVRHSKKPKKFKGGIEHQAKSHHVSKKLVKKVHWWQLLRRRPQRMKMPKKPSVKLGFGTKKSKLQAVPTIKWH